MKGENNKAVYETVIRSRVVGDDIRIDDMTEDKFVLKNVREKSAFLLNLSKKCADVSNTFFFTDIDPSGYTSRTNDRGMWVAGYTIQCWESGQRIVIKKSTDEAQYENYEMINPQDGSSAWLT